MGSRIDTTHSVSKPWEVVLTPHTVCLSHVKWYGHVSPAKTILQGTVKGRNKTRQTEEEVGRQHQGMDRPGVRQVQDGSGEQRKMEVS